MWLEIKSFSMTTTSLISKIDDVFIIVWAHYSYTIVCYLICLVKLEPGNVYRKKDIQPIN